MLFDNVDSVKPTAQQMAVDLLHNANNKFTALIVEAYNDFDNFWKLEATGGPSGIQILEALGTKAETIYSMAWARVELLITIAQIVNKPSMVDLAKLIPPYEVTFKPDGSLDSATPRL